MRIIALVKRICKEMIRDKRTLALLLVAPLLILTLMHFLFNGNTVDPKLGVVNVDNSIIKTLKNENIQIIKYEKANKQTVVKDRLDGLLENQSQNLKLTLENSDPTIAKTLQMKVSQSLVIANQSQRMTQLSTNINSPKSSLKTNYVYGNSKTDFFDVLSPILIGFFVFFFVFLISGIGLLKERTSGTLDRLMATPIRRGEIVTAYLIGFGLFAIIQTIIVVVFSINVLGIVLAGSIWNVIFINLLLALVALSLGTLLSSFAASEFQMVQFIPLVVIPQIFFAGIFPYDGMAKWLQWIGKIMPLYYGADALKSIMYKGFSIGNVDKDVFILIAYAIFFVVLNVLALKKYRKL